MTILPDGRWRLSSTELANKVWEKLKGWRLDTDGRHLVPNFPSCTRRSLETICQPCGKQSAIAYYCNKHAMRISVSYCNACAAKGENEPVPPTPKTDTGGVQDDAVQLPASGADLLGTKPTDLGG